MAITNKDIEKLKEHFTTKDEMRQGFGKIADKLDEHGRRFNEIGCEITDKFDKVLSGLDKIAGELEKVREDRELAKTKDSEHDRRLDGLEGRMQKVETRVG